MTVITDTDIGLVRAENQDRVKAEEISENIVLAVICDGMGGQNAGSEAGELASNIVFDRISASVKKGPDKSSIKNIMRSAVAAANAVIYDAAIQDYQKIGMGTTCAAVVIYENTINIICAGDSRVYLIRNGMIRQITNDHTVVRMLYEQGKIAEDEIRTHPQRNLITKAVGVKETIEPDYFEEPFENDSIILLCTDGLSNYCENEEMLEIVKNTPFFQIPKALINKALKNGGSDNITLALISDK